jgi:hypothetical protein
MTSILRWTALLALIPLAVQAAEVTRRSSMFDAPSDTAQQLRVLSPGAKVQVTGEDREDDEGAAWVPVQAGSQKGWIKKRTVTLEEGDSTFVAAPHPREKSRAMLWASLGPASISSSEHSFGARVAAGLDLLLGPKRQGMLGIFFSKPFSNEVITDPNFAGGVQRLNFFADLGYFFIPETLWLRGFGGLSVLGGSNPNVLAKLKPTYGAEIGYQIPLNSTAHIGASLSWEHTGAASTSIAVPVDAIGCALGDCNSTGTVPLANVVALNLVLSLNP